MSTCQGCGPASLVLHSKNIMCYKRDQALQNTLWTDQGKAILPCHVRLDFFQQFRDLRCTNKGVTACLKTWNKCHNFSSRFSMSLISQLARTWWFYNNSKWKWGFPHPSMYCATDVTERGLSDFRGLNYRTLCLFNKKEICCCNCLDNVWKPGTGSKCVNSQHPPHFSFNDAL